MKLWRSKGNGSHEVERHARHHRRALMVVAACLLAGAVSLMAFGRMGQLAQALGSSSATTTIESVSMGWSDSPNNDTYVQKPSYNGTTEFKASFGYALSGSESHKAGTVTIRIPAHLFYKRGSSDWADTARLSVPEAPATSDVGYNYTYDSATDEYVFTNVKEIPAAGNATFDVTYSIDKPSDVVDMAASRNLSASMTVKTDDGQTLQMSSKAITAKVDTHVGLSKAEKSEYQVLGSRPSEWGGDSKGDDYVYVVWNVSVLLKGDATQPFKLNLSDAADSNQEVLGWRLDGSLADRRTDGTLTNFVPTGDFHEGSTVDLSGEPPVASDANAMNGYRLSVLTRCPRSKLTADGTTLKNTVTATVTGVDDNAGNTVTADAEHTVKSSSFVAPGATSGIWKDGIASAPGGINLVESDKSAGFDDYYDNNTIVQQYDKTLRVGGDSSNPNDYGQRAYTVELTDDLWYLKDESNNVTELGDGDYQIETVRFLNWKSAFWDYSDTTGTGFNEVKNTNWNKQPAVVLWGRFGSGSEWTKLGELGKTSGNENGLLTYKDYGTGKVKVLTNEAAEAQELKLSDGCTAVKVTCSSKFYKTQLDLQVRPRLLPSQKVKSLLAGKERVYLTDVNTLQVFDADGKSVSFGDNELWENDNTYVDRDAIAARDQRLYGGSRPHAWQDGSVTKSKSTSAWTKELTSYENETEHKRIKLNYRARYQESLRFTNDITKEEVLQQGLFSMQPKATFYDLLPKGVEPDLSTIVVRRFNNGGADEGVVDNDATVTAKTIKNWRNSGRTMLVVEATPSSVDNNQRVSYGAWSARIDSLMGVDFSAYYSWDSMTDYGNELENDVAMVSGNDSVADGSADVCTHGAPANGGYQEMDQTVKDLLTDLDGDGNPEGTKSRFLYAKTVNTVNAEVSSSSALTKTVMGPGNDEWTDGRKGDVIVSEGDSYDYRLRTGANAQSSVTDIVLYDALEGYAPKDGGAQWRGTLVSVDTSQLVERGIRPTVYYSVKQGIDLSSESDRNLSDASVWSSQAPDDLSKVTAIAIDCTQATDGSEFTLGANKTISAIVHMTAPTGEAFKKACTSSAHAYNQVYETCVLHNRLGGATEAQTMHNEWTQVGVRPQANYMPTTGSVGRPVIELAGVCLLAAAAMLVRHAWLHH